MPIASKTAHQPKKLWWSLRPATSIKIKKSLINQNHYHEQIFYNSSTRFTQFNPFIISQPGK
jgi:hypothetical protein